MADARAPGRRVNVTASLPDVPKPRPRGHCWLRLRGQYCPVARNGRRSTILTYVPGPKSLRGCACAARRPAARSVASESVRVLRVSRSNMQLRDSAGQRRDVISRRSPVRGR